MYDKYWCINDSMIYDIITFVNCMMISEVFVVLEWWCNKIDNKVLLDISLLIMIEVVFLSCDGSIKYENSFHIKMVYTCIK